MRGRDRAAVHHVWKRGSAAWCGGSRADGGRGRCAAAWGRRGAFPEDGRLSEWEISCNIHARWTSAGHPDGLL